MLGTELQREKIVKGERGNEGGREKSKERLEAEKDCL